MNEKIIFKPDLEYPKKIIFNDKNTKERGFEILLMGGLFVRDGENFTITKKHEKLLKKYQISYKVIS